VIKKLLNYRSNKLKYTAFPFVNSIGSLYCFFIISFVILSSCSAERKLAEEFINSGKPVSIFLIKPTNLINTNLKTEIVDTIKNIDQYTKDSLLINSSIFLKNIIDSLFLNEYYFALKNSLAEYSISVYTDSESDKFFKDTTNAYIFNLAQNEVEEYIMTYSPSVEVDTTLYFRNFFLNAVNFNNWLEVTELNGYDKKMKVFYISQYASDDIQGRFTRDFFTGEIEYYYSEYKIDLKDVYNLTYYSAEVNANYIFDYIMNCYIAKKMNRADNDKNYFHFDPVKKRIVRANEKRFELLK